MMTMPWWQGGVCCTHRELGRHACSANGFDSVISKCATVFVCALLLYALLLLLLLVCR
jgi:hypothetical protein